MPPNQAFCSNCGADLRPVRNYQPPQPPVNQGPPVEGGAYGYDPNPYGYAQPPLLRRPSNAVIWGIVAAVAIICLCCGLVMGAAGMYWLGPTPTPVSVPVIPTPTITPTSLIQFFMYG